MELNIASKHHSQLIGRRGAAVNKLQEDTGVRVIFPSNSKSNDGEEVTIIGKKENVEKV